MTSMAVVPFNAVSAVTELFSLFAPEIMFFSLAMLGMVLFSNGMLGPLIARLGPSASGLAQKKLVDDEEPQHAEEEDEELPPERQLKAALSEKKHAEAVRLWRDQKFTMGMPFRSLFVELLEALKSCGSSGQSFVVELQQAAERNPQLCEGEAMECLFLALDTDGALREGFASALGEVGRLTPKLRLALIEQAFRREDLDESLERLMSLPGDTEISSKLGTLMLRLAGSKGRLPGAVAAMMDARIGWELGALEDPMAEATDRGDAEGAIQLHRAAGNLDIPRTAKDAELLLSCLEAAEAPAALRVVAEDIAHQPNLEITETLGLALVRAGVDESPQALASVLGRPCSPAVLLGAA